MLEEGLYYPFQGEDWIERFVTGGVLTLISVLILPGLVLGGYVYRILETTLEDGDSPPAFDRWDRMLSDGLEVVLVSIVYALVPFLVAAAIGSVLIVGEAPIEDFLAPSGMITAVLFVLAFTVVYYLLPVALANMVRENDVDGAFDYATLSQVWFSNTYAVSAVGPISLAILAHFATFAVYVTGLTMPMSVTAMGVVVLPFLHFYVHVAIFRTLGNVFDRETRRESVQDAPRAVLS